ncbi:MAG TPA: substrate-binding domain-containing protein [Stellaceae bacterium]|nr:substrate-binding domain-containing protein [Stellaceae bacterium]
MRPILLLLLCAMTASTASAAEKSFVLATTTSLEDSGLLDDLLPRFTKESGIKVRVVAQGTGQALDTARRGDADLVLVHDPDAEAKFMSEGFGVTRRQIAWNDFIVVGPKSDPAHVAGTHDAVAALEQIAKSQAPFVSRGDRSGTNALELRLWAVAKITPPKVAGGWYRDIGGGMGQALNDAAAMEAYTISDRGTWLSFANKRDLVIAVEGDSHLINRYDVIELDAKRHPETHDMAKQLADWLVAPAGQDLIGAYRKGGQQLFHPSAANPK